MDGEKIVLLALFVVGLLNLTAHHTQVSKHLDVVLVLFKTSFEALSALNEGGLLPVDMAESVPSAGIGGHELYGLGEALLSVLGVLWQEVEGLAAEVEEFGLFLFVLN